MGVKYHSLLEFRLGPQLGTSYSCLSIRVLHPPETRPVVTLHTLSEFSMIAIK